MEMSWNDARLSSWLKPHDWKQMIIAEQPFSSRSDWRVGTLNYRQVFLKTASLEVWFVVEEMKMHLNVSVLQCCFWLGTAQWLSFLPFPIFRFASGAPHLLKPTWIIHIGFSFLLSTWQSCRWSFGVTQIQCTARSGFSHSSHSIDRNGFYK